MEHKFEPNMAVSIPNRDTNGEPTLAQARVMQFENGKTIAVFAEHPENKGPALSEVRSEVVGALCERQGIQPSQLRYMEFEPSLGQSPYREFSFSGSASHPVQNGPDMGHTEAQMTRIVDLNRGPGHGPGL